MAGYEISEEISRSDFHFLCRGTRGPDRSACLLKVPRRNPPRRVDVDLLRRELGFLKESPAAGVPRAIELVRIESQPCLVLEGHRGKSLATNLESGLADPGFVLDLSIRLCAVLADLHRADIIHGALRPGSVLVDPDSGEVALTDFCVASRGAGEPLPLHLMREALAYISPEQTGRMNRSVDHRSDLYALGALMYEMLLGRPPFQSEDPLELIHAHIARMPVPPAQASQSVPPVLSDLVMKLLSKTAEQRYQSAAGVRHDLEACAREWSGRRTIEPFRLAERDVPDRFLISQKLYGRERDVKQLHGAFERVCSGPSAMVLVGGYAGIGKTSLIQELYRPIVVQHGSFVAGKFDQVVRNTPYGALIQAFRGLVLQLLSESEESLAVWRDRLSEALGAGGGVITEVIPELVLILGPQPRPMELGPAESQNRFRLVLQNFVGTLSRPDHPLVIFLDDLQWVDAGTLSLLEPLLTSPDVRCLLIIGAFRDNEVDEAHPLARTLGTLRAAGARLDSITLGALGMGDMLQFASDTLRSEPAEVEPLARLVLEKTGGNPFFVIQFLRTLHEDRLLHFDESRRQWGFKIEEIRGAPLTDNVVDLMTRKIRRLPDDTRRVLTLAACIGNQFEAQVLATACELTAEEAIARVAPAVEDGLILPLRRDYEPEGESPAGEPAAPQAAFAFLHDRVQQAAYALIPEADRRLVHLTVGRLLLARRARADAADDRIFDVVHHLNLGSELIADPEEKLNLARLNLAAGRKARTSAAFLEALRHFRSGCALLDGLSGEGEEAWRTHYSLSFELNMHAAECEYLCGNFQEADRYFGLMLSRARTRLDKALVHCLRTLQYENLSLYPDAVRAAREGLELFDLALPDTTDAQAAALDEEIAGIERRLQDRSIASLEELPWMQDEDLRALMRLLTIAWAPAYISGGSLLSRLISALLVRLSLDHGVTEESAYGYVTHAISVGPIGGDYRSAYEWGRLALAVTERFEDSRLKAKIHQQFHAHVTLWRRPLASCIPHAREACRSGLEIGDLIYAGYGAFTESWPAILISRDLERFVRDISPSLALLHKIRRNSLVEAQRDILGFARALQGLTRHRLSFSHEGFVEEEFLRRFEGQPFFTTYHHVLKLYLCLLLEEGREALATAPLAREAVAALEGTLWPVFLDFVEGIALAQFRDEGRAEAIPAELVRSCDRMSHLAENCPDNFLCWSLMLQAERARLEKRDREAQRLYDEAIRYARETESLQNEALANELCARYWRGAGNARIATLYLKVAHSLYELWGASAKTRDLEHRYPDLLAGDESGAAAPTASGSMAEAGAPAIETEPAFLDISTFAKAANAIAVEIFLDDLLRKLVRIAIENAGAQRGLFLQEKDGRLVIEAEGSVDADEIRLPRSAPLDEGAALCRAVVHYARKTGQSVVVADASADDRFASDPYVAAARPRSILCVPVVHQGRLGGLLYLENNLSADSFTSDRVRVMQILSAQAAISLENSRLYEDMRQEVSLRRKAETDLRAALAELEKLKNRLQAENVYLQEEIRREHNFEELVGSSPALLDLLEKVERVAPTDTTVLVYGETGTGKELLARALHNRSARRQRPLAKVNCGAIPAGLMESELFGHVKGAFTGALERRVGRFELADGGTLFLDEVGELPLETQVKLLRVLQEREFEPVGSNRTVRVDVRVIAATNRDLEQAVRDGRFRADLYYRLSVFPLKVPALRERASDVPQLVMYFLARFARKLGRRVDTVPRATMDRLARYAWPGNIRELQNIIERAVILSPGSSLELGDDLLPVATEAPARLSVTLPAVPESIHPASGSPPEVAQAAPPASLREVEKLHILEALSRTNWVIEGPRGAALILSLHPNTLRSRMKKLGIRR